jgi:intracellular multiplication protein IcmB
VELGPIELWAFSTTAEDAMVRNQLYRHLGPAEARRFLALLFPNGSVAKELAERLNLLKETGGLIEEEGKTSVVDQLVNEILMAYSQDPNTKSLPPPVRQ